MKCLSLCRVVAHHDGVELLCGVGHVTAARSRHEEEEEEEEAAAMAAMAARTRGELTGVPCEFTDQLSAAATRRPAQVASFGGGGGGGKQSQSKPRLLLRASGRTR